jgi:hypothetical protein
LAAGTPVALCDAMKLTGEIIGAMEVSYLKAPGLPVALI